MSRTSLPIHVAGVGASAGGLEAMLVMFAHLRPTGRVAYVVAQHMADNGHSDLVVRLIQRQSLLPVKLAEHGVRLRADTVFVIPAGKDGHVDGNILRLCDPAPEHLSTPSVNALFSSIAKTCGVGAIGIILSGAGSDGVIGCRAIKNGGGTTLAQQPDEAKFDGMPGAAIRARQIDHVLTADKIGDAVAQIFGLDPAAGKGSEAAGRTIPEAGYAELQTVIRKVHEATGIDFSMYKEETLFRRLEKRKSILGVDSAEAYQAVIRRDPDELHALQHLFLVSVSSFFRDREAFRALATSLAGTLAEKGDGEPIRVWVPGCASGEEPYTIAIILSELLGHRRQDDQIMIVGNDLNPEALAVAENGIFPGTAFAEMDQVLRDRYFNARGQHFEIKPELKSRVTFVRRDVFSGCGPDDLDLVSCRNLLIYLKSNLQDNLVKTIHQSLRPKGMFFIGQSESLGIVGNSLFGPIDQYHRLFRRRG